MTSSLPYCGLPFIVMAVGGSVGREGGKGGMTMPTMRPFCSILDGERIALHRPIGIGQAPSVERAGPAVMCAGVHDVAMHPQIGRQRLIHHPVP